LLPFSHELVCKELYGEALAARSRVAVSFVIVVGDIASFKQEDAH